MIELNGVRSSWLTTPRNACASETLARFTAAVRQLGAPAPEDRDLVEVDGGTIRVLDPLFTDAVARVVLDLPAPAGSG